VDNEDEWEIEEINDDEAEAEEPPLAIPFSAARKNRFPLALPPPPPSPFGGVAGTGGGGGAASPRGTAPAPPVPTDPPSSEPLSPSPFPPNGGSSIGIPQAHYHQQSLQQAQNRPMSVHVSRLGLGKQGGSNLRPISTPGNVPPAAFPGMASRPMLPPRETKPPLKPAPDERLQPGSIFAGSSFSNSTRHAQRSADWSAILERKLEAGPPPIVVNSSSSSSSSSSSAQQQQPSPQLPITADAAQEEDKDDKKEAGDQRKKFWSGTGRKLDKVRIKEDEEKEKEEKEKERERERERKEEKKKEKEEKRSTLVGKKFRVRRKKENKPIRGRQSSGSIIISAPAGAQHRVILPPKATIHRTCRV